jgi:hypothetical protein
MQGCPGAVPLLSRAQAYRPVGLRLGLCTGALRFRVPARPAHARFYPVPGHKNRGLSPYTLSATQVGGACTILRIPPPQVRFP